MTTIWTPREQTDVELWSVNSYPWLLPLPWQYEARPQTQWLTREDLD